MDNIIMNSFDFFLQYQGIRMQILWIVLASVLSYCSVELSGFRTHRKGLNVLEIFRAVPIFSVIPKSFFRVSKVLAMKYASLGKPNNSFNNGMTLMKSIRPVREGMIRLTNFDIEFKNVSFSHNGKTILRNINCLIPENSITALVGASGAGKNTMAKLILKVLEVDSGEVTISGTNLKHMTEGELNSYISEIFLEVKLNADSIYNNIKSGKPTASDDEIMKVSANTHVLEFCKSLPNGIHTAIGEGGTQLSRGQEQCVSIARALLKDAPIVLLEEIVVEYYLEKADMQRIVSPLLMGKTVVIIARKLKNIQGVQQIIVLGNTQILEQGIHHNLMDKKWLYHYLWSLQKEHNNWRIPVTTS